MTTPDTLRKIALLAAAMRAYDRAFGLDEHLITCGDCGATWIGYDNDPCDWCTRALERQRDHQRDLLLHPAWFDGEQGDRYNALSEIDKQVWNRARGISNDGAVFWAQQLRRAVDSGLVTEHEAERAVNRVTDERAAS